MIKVHANGTLTPTQTRIPAGAIHLFIKSNEFTASCGRLTYQGFHKKVNSSLYFRISCNRALSSHNWFCWRFSLMWASHNQTWRQLGNFSVSLVWNIFWLFALVSWYDVTDDWNGQTKMHSTNLWHDFSLQYRTKFLLKDEVVVIRLWCVDQPLNYWDKTSGWKLHTKWQFA